MENDVIVGAMDNYTWSQVRNWAVSLSRSGFSGRKIVLLYREPDPRLRQELQNLGFEVYQPQVDNFGHEINHGQRVQYGAANTVSHEIRFFHTWQLLMDDEFRNTRYVAIADTRDVVFQTDPSKWIEENIGEYGVFAPSEGLKYRQENWNKDNAYRGFGPVTYELLMQNNIICNVGTIGGKYKEFTDFLILLFSIIEGRRSYPGDQCTMGFLTTLSFLKDTVKVVLSEDGWVCSCGTFLEPKNAHLNQFLLEPKPRMGDDGVVYTNDGKPYSLVHQYERVPGWEEVMTRRFS